jgi:hypothetical protein
MFTFFSFLQLKKQASTKRQVTLLLLWCSPEIEGSILLYRSVANVRAQLVEWGS